MPEEESEVSFAYFGGSKRLRAISAKPPTTPPRAEVAEGIGNRWSARPVSGG